jgi:hypothetical protein
MTLTEAIAEVKRLWVISAPSPDETNWAAIVFNAVASGDLIPKADAEQAVAVAYQRAADACRDLASPADLYIHRIACSACSSAILALAPADALAEVERMRAAHEDTCAKLNGYITFAVEQQERAEAAEAEVARLTGYLREIESLTVHSGGDIHGVAPSAWRYAFGEARDIARAALKGDTP